MHIRTNDGWKQLAPRNCTAPGHTTTLLERMGAKPDHDGLKEMVRYACSEGKGAYFTYNLDGTAFQSRGALNPLPGMKGEEAFD